MQYSYFDIHSHLNFPQFDPDREALIARMKEEGIGTITVGTSLKASQEAVALAQAHEHLFATIGIHPTDHEAAFDESAFDALVSDASVVAIGECGLDYFRTEDESQRRKQQALFSAHIAFAQKHGKPLMIHGRPSKGSMDAYEDIVRLLAGSAVRGNVHFFVGTVDIARRFLDIGCTLSFDGPITFSSDYDEVIRYVPEDSLMAETDAPFAAPEPFRGKRNEPSFVRYVVDRMAEIREVAPDEMAGITLANALKTFSIPGSLRT